MSRSPQPSSTRRGALVGAEIGLLVLALGVATTFTRLFEDWAWLGRLAIPVTVSWALSVLLRRSGTGVALSSAVQAGTAVLVLSWLFAPDSLALFVPTPTTWTELATEVSSSFASFSDLVAPVPATNGFLFVISAALWTIGSFADIAALRYRAPVQAAVPYAASFVAVGILARDSGRTTSAIAFAVALGVFAATQQGLGATERRWVAGRVAGGTRAVFGSALAVALVAVVGGLAFGPLLPGGSRPVIDLRQLGSGEGPRTVVSPFVGIRSLLGERSDQVMFTVRADDSAYWRLTSLERYDPDRQIWVSRSSFRPTDGELPPTMDAEVDSRPLRQEYRMEALSTVWLPAAYVPRRVDSPAALGFDPDSASLFLRDSDAEGGLRYELESELPDIAPVIGAADVGSTADLDPEYLTTPPVDPDTAALLASVTSEADGPYEQLLALQNWFRSEFTYDDGVDFSREQDALGAFLATRRGFCQQFASTFAVFARSLGIPSRVAVGFTPGDPVAAEDAEPDSGPSTGGSTADPEESTASRGGPEFVVRGRHAHAWPEVHFEGVGWVPFEPTPQRGNPQAQGYTGVAPDQAGAPAEQAVTTTTTSAPSSPTTPTSSPEQIDATGSPEIPDSTTGSTDDWALGVVLVVVTLALVGGSALFAARRRPRRADAPGDVHDAAVAASWADAVRALALIDLRSGASETPVEFARRADPTLTGVSLAPLALAETRRRFGEGVSTAADVETARFIATAIVEQVRDATTRRHRMTSRLVR